MTTSIKTCAPCVAGEKPMPEAEIRKSLAEVTGWEITLEGKAIKRRYGFPDFLSALDFVNHIAPIAELEGHHPDITFGWGYAEIMMWTHSLQGLHRNDFIMAKKINELFDHPAT